MQASGDGSMPSEVQAYLTQLSQLADLHEQVGLAPSFWSHLGESRARLAQPRPGSLCLGSAWCQGQHTWIV